MKIIVSLLLFLVAACSTTTGGSADKIVIAPSDEFFDLACQNIGDNAADFSKRHFGFQADTANTVFGGVFDDVKNKDLSYLYSIDTAGFFQYFNSHLANDKAPRIAVQEITVFVGSGGIMADEAPVFIIEVKAARRDGSTFVVRKGAEGPAYSSFSVWDIRTSEIAKRSENIGYFAAFLRVIEAMEREVAVVPQANAATAEK